MNARPLRSVLLLFVVARRLTKVTVVQGSVYNFVDSFFVNLTIVPLLLFFNPSLTAGGQSVIRVVVLSLLPAA